jgi:hypothetical protein
MLGLFSYHRVVRAVEKVPATELAARLQALVDNPKG